MNKDEIGKYITEALAGAKTEEEIYLFLLNHGLKVSEIELEFARQQAQSARDKTAITKTTVRVFVFIGALLVGAGIFSFIAANWNEMSRLVKISIILSAMIVSHAAGWLFKEKAHLLRTGESLIFLGTLIFGSGIFLIGQMFHTTAIWPDGFVFWLVGTLVMAFAVESASFLYLAIILSFVALFGYPSHMFSRFGPQARFFLTSNWLLLLAALTTFYAGWKLRKKVPSEFKDL